MKKPLKISAWSGIFVLIIYAIISPIVVLTMADSSFREVISFLGIILGGALSILFLNGFIVLGERFKSRMLVVMSWIGIGLFVLYLIFGAFMSFSLFFKNVGAQEKVSIPLVDTDNLDYLFGQTVYIFMILVIIAY